MVAETFMVPMDDDELQAELWDRLGRALNNVDNELSNQRTELIKYYRGEELGTEIKGYSKARTRQSMEAVEWAMPHIIRAFFSGSSPVKFSPLQEDDEEQARQETDVVMSILRKTEYYTALETWFRSTLIDPNGYVKVWWEDKSAYSPPTDYSGLTYAQVGMLSIDPNVYIENADVDEDNLFSVQVRYADKRGKICIQAVPPEEVLVDNDITCTDLDSARLVAHNRQVTKSYLVEQGYDPNVVLSLPTSDRLRESTEREKRRITEDEQDYLHSGITTLVDLFEIVVCVDQDGDGIAEKRKIVMAGTTGNSEFLENEETDYQPLIALATIPQPHRHPGESMVQMTKENELIQSTLTRQMLDNLYRTNRPRTYAGRGVQIDQLMTYVPHSVVECEDPRMIATEQTPPIVASLMPAFDYFERRFEATSGVTRMTQGLDARTLAEAPMTSYLGARNDSTSRIELIIGSWARTGIAKLFQKVHHLMRKHQDVKHTIKMRGKWIDIDPSTWRDRFDTEPQVGLGTGTPEENVSAGLSVLELQKEALSHGLTSARHIYRTLDDICRGMGKPGAGRYFYNPETPEGKQAIDAVQKQKQEAQAKQEMLIAEGLRLDAQDKHANRMIEVGELQRKIEKDTSDAEFDRTQLEVQEDENIPGSAV